ncbi:MAG: outer membrane protein assembly factor BamD, partial [Phycisphaerae bacterium]
DAQAPEAMVLRAAIEIARSDYYKAHLHLQEFLDLYGTSRQAARALELEFIVAERFLNGTRRKVWGMRLLSATDKGLEMLDEIAADYPGSSLAEKAIKTKADHYFNRGDFTLAEFEYSRLGEEFPRSRYARLSLRKSAESALASFPGIDFDDAALIEAEERFKVYLAQYPGSAEQEGVGQILQQIYAQRAAKEFSVGQFYERTRRLDSAIFYYRSTLNNWPDTIGASRARQRLQALGAEGSQAGEPAAELTSLER